MKKSTIITVLIASILYVSCSDNEIDNQLECTGENYTIDVNRFIKKLTTTNNFGNLPVIRNYEYTYDSYNLLTTVDDYTFDTNDQLNYKYLCSNNINSVLHKNNGVKSEYSYDEEK